MNNDTIAQFNLFTGELEPPRKDEIPWTGWLFDPDFRVILPEERGGQEIMLGEGVLLAFPAGERLRARKAVASVGAISSLAAASTGNGAVVYGKAVRRYPDADPWVAQTEDAAQLILSGFGIYLGKKSERLQVKVQGKVAYEFPFFRISEVVVASRGVSLSSDLLKEFCEHGIRLTFIEPSGRPYAMLSSPILTATVATRREQLMAYYDERGLEISKLTVRGKIRNQRHLLLYCGKYLKGAAPERYAVIARLAPKLRALELKVRAVKGKHIEECSQMLRSLEGKAGQLYWEGIRTIVGNKAEFAGRVHQGANDPVNSLLNFGYAILYSNVWGALMNAGLEPFGGYLHVDRPGKPSLVLDMVEEFRQPVVDRSVVAAIGRGTAIETHEGMLTDTARRSVAAAVRERIESEVTFRGRRYKLKPGSQRQ